ncbi:MAG: nucleic acid-binding protein [Anaerolineae bacterium]|nr:nucleic acid-binding protein [Anaerolineae bacterium]MCI0607704.1 nucleic acid-binding protein [Anaerolineae bacterium]
MDIKSHLRITLEADAVLGILSLVEANKVDLISSEVLLFEINRNSNQIRKEYALEVISKAKNFVRMNSKIEKRSRQFVDLGIHFLDAVHLASAEEARVDYFCTCDDVFLKKALQIQGLKIKVASPVDLAKEL